MVLGELTLRMRSTRNSEVVKAEEGGGIFAPVIPKKETNPLSKR